MMHAEWLPVIMQGSFSEIYVMDGETLRFLAVNAAACTNLQYTEDQVVGKTLPDIALHLTQKVLEQALAPLLGGQASQVVLNTTHVRMDGSFYPIEFRFLGCMSGGAQVLIGIANDMSLRYESAKALLLSESRFRAISSNTPGLVYQFILEQDGTTSFPYVSEGCPALLGLTAQQLCSDSSLFVDLILPEDRPSYLVSMAASANDMKSWNWEGRIWIEEWKDVKWINLRSTPRVLPSNRLQWDGIMTNITQSKLEEVEIKQSRAQLAELSAHIQTVKEQERTRIAREIHDDMGGNLTAIKMALALLAKRLPEGNSDLNERTAYLDSLVDRTIEAIHRIAGDLRPGILDFGVVAAIEWQATEFEKQLGIPCEFSTNKKDIELHLDQATALFRIFQEALTNIGKHARATNVAVRLESNKHSVLLEIRDNGRGMEPTDRLKPKSFGIRDMMERAAALGGELSIGAAEKGGSVVTIKIPLSSS